MRKVWKQKERKAICLSVGQRDKETSEVLAAVFMKFYPLQRSIAYSTKRFCRKYRLHLTSRRVSGQESNRKQASSNPAEGGDMVLEM
jgi:hypothetical protein